jgi:hypothetical protein
MEQNLKYIAFAVLLIIGAILLFGSAMNKPVTHDEQMYVTGGVLLAKGFLPYRDFSYVAQLPAHPLILAAVYKVTHADHYLLVARLFSVFCDLGILAVIVAVYLNAFKKNVFAGLVFAFIAAALFIFNPFVDYTLGRAWNHDCVILCAVLAFWLYARFRESLVAISAMGFLLAFSTCMRPTNAFIWFIFLLFIYLHNLQNRADRFRVVGMFLAGSVIAAAWPIYVLTRSTQAAWIDLVVIPMLNGSFLHSIGMIFPKWSLLLYAIGEPGYVLNVGAAVILWIWCFKRKLSLSRECLLAVAITVGYFIVAVIPPTMWQQYLAPPVPFLLISMAYPLARIIARMQELGHLGTVRAIKCAFMIIAIVVVASYPAPLLNIRQVLSPGSWIPVQVNAVAKDIAARTKDGLILTTSPIYALEAGRPIYNEFSAGPFAFRVADFLTTEQQANAKVIGFKEIPELTAKNAPDAILLDKTELPFINDALLNMPHSGWHTIDYDEPTPVQLIYK